MADCVYCGADATDRDHVTPVAWNHYKRPKAVSYRDTVPACKQCNSILRDVPRFTVRDRAEYLIGRYREKARKARKQLKMLLYYEMLAKSEACKQTAFW